MPSAAPQTTAPIATAPSQATDGTSGLTAKLWSAGAWVAFTAFCLTTAHVSPFALVLAAAGLGVTAVAGLVAAAVWGRPVAQAWFSGLLCAMFGILLYIRLVARPELGVSYQNESAGALVTEVRPDGPLGQLGWRAPMLIQSVDGVKVGAGKAELSSVIATRRVLDRVTLTVSTPDGLVPRTFEATLFDR